LKLAHAQRLLPLEQLLSGTELRSPAPERKPALISEQKKSEPLSARPFISPFAADSARKGTPRSDASAENTAQRPASAAITSAPVVMGSAAPAVAREPETSPGATLVPQQKAAAPESERNSAGIDEIRVAVLETLASAGQNMLCSMLEPGEWKIAGNELVIRIAASATLIEMSVGAEAKRRITAAASGKLGRAVKLQVLPGAAPVSTSKPFVPSSNGSTRSRAEQEPVVQRLKEKFGAQIRTVIDYRKR